MLFGYRQSFRKRSRYVINAILDTYERGLSLH